VSLEERKKGGEKEAANAYPKIRRTQPERHRIVKKRSGSDY